MKLKILLLCDSSVRELDSLKFLKNVLTTSLKADVNILGSIADWDVIYYHLFKMKPDVVFLTQVQEEKCHSLAEYIKASGAKVCVIPPETTLVKALQDLIVNPKLKYDELIDFLFLPGKSLYKFYQKTNIQTDKIYVTGSPKVDVLINAVGDSFFSRERFLSKFKIPQKRKNIFIFTSFRGYSKEYIKQDIAFTGVTEIANAESDFIENSLQKYLQVLPKLCEMYSECNVILKPHPLENKDVYKKIDASNFYLLDQSSTLQMCLKSIDLAIHWNSTIAAECWLHQLKTIQYSPETEYNYLLSDLSQGNPLYDDAERFLKDIKKYLTSNMNQKYFSFQRKYLERNYGSLKPDSSQKIADVLAKNLNKREISTSYKKNFHHRTAVFIFIEHLIGPTITRWLAHLYLQDYNWRYSSENYVRE